MSVNDMLPSVVQCIVKLPIGVYLILGIYKPWPNSNVAIIMGNLAKGFSNS